MLRGILQCLEATKVDRCLDGRVEPGASESRVDFEANVGTGFGQLGSEGGRQTAVRENGRKNTPDQVAQRLQGVLGLRAELCQACLLLECQPDIAERWARLRCQIAKECTIGRGERFTWRLAYGDFADG